MKLPHSQMMHWIWPLRWAQYRCTSSYDRYDYHWNGQVLHRSTYQPLTPDELLDKDESDAQDQLIARVYEILGSQVCPRVLEDVEWDNTQLYDPYDDEKQNKQSFPQLA